MAEATALMAAPGGELRLRIISAAVLAGLALAAAWLGGWPAALAMALASAVVCGEWMGITGVANPLLMPGFAGLAGVAVLLGGVGLLVPAALLIAAGLILAAIATGLWPAVGILYAAVPGLAMLLIRASPDGLASLAFLLAIVWAADTAAYFVGRAVGGPKLWPAVSPKKTWSGFVGGLVFAVAAGLAVAAIAGVPLSPGLGVTATVLALASTGGDLLESALKRRFAVKDASALIPGHGGLMDRVDGLFVAGVVAALVGLAHGGPEQLGPGLLHW